MKNNYEYLSMDYEKNQSGITIKKRKLIKDYPIHFHNFFEIEYILSGEGVTYINNTPFKISAGNLIFITPTDFQSIEVKTPLEIINLNFTSDWIDKSIVHFCESATVLKNIKDNNVLSALNEFDNNLPHKDLCIRGYLNALLVEILRQNIPYLSDSQNEISHRIAHYIKIHHSEKITLESIATAFGYSPNYISTVFSKSYNITLKQFIINTRLEHSLKMLLSTNVSVTSICFECGFTSFSNFLRTFKTTYNMTPSDYRSKFKPQQY